MAKVELSEWMQAYGIPTQDIHGHDIPNWDRSFQRFPTAPDGRDDAGWIRSGKDPDGHRFCQAGDHRKRGSHWTWQDGTTSARGLSQEEKAARLAERIATKEQERRDLDEKRAKAAIDARKRLAEAKLGRNAYMVKKGITGELLTATDKWGDHILVPITSPATEVVNAQRIYADGTKKYLPHCRIDGCYHLIGEMVAPLLICEGFATGHSLHLATGKNVIVAFSAGNIEKVIKEISKSFRNDELLLCADDDRWSQQNLGKVIADAIASKYGIRAAFPAWPAEIDESKKPTDFNDLFLMAGKEAVRAQIYTYLQTTPKPSAEQRPSHEENEFVECLGHKDGTYYYTSSSNKQIRALGSSNHGAGPLCDLMPYEYWVARFSNSKGTINWTAAGSYLMSKCRERGLYDALRLRGRGAWKGEKGGIIIHHGDHLTVQANRRGLRDAEAGKKYVYALGLDLPELHPEPLTALEGKKLRNVCDLMTWTSKASPRLFAGYASAFRIAGALEWRPHAWITGSAGCGKTETAMKMLKQLSGEFGVIADGGTTEAAIRQTLVEDSRPVIYDEAENEEGNASLLRNLIRLIRQASRGGTIMKGTPSGKSLIYRVNGCFALGSIRTSLTQEQDMSRFTVLELAREKKNDWPTVEAGIASMDEEYGERLFSRMVSRFADVEASIKMFHSVLLQEKCSSREADQLAALLGCGWIAENDAVVTAEEARTIVAEVHSKAEAEERRIAPDELECIEHLLGVTVAAKTGMYGNGSTERISVAGLIQVSSGDDSRIVDLELYGMTINRDRLHISVSHPELRKLFKDTRWHSSWSQALKRLPLAEPGNTRFSDRVRRRTVSIPVTSIAGTG